MSTIVITGASDGIGATAAALLARDGHRLFLVGRTASKLEAVTEKLYPAGAFVADFERLDDVRRLAADLRAATDHIDVLANNAGGIFDGPLETIDGFERTFQVNHLAPFLLTHELMDLLLAGDASVVNTASAAARMSGHIDLDDIDGWHRYAPMKAYGASKLANVLFTRGLHARYHHLGLSAVAFHPGVIASNFGASTGGPMRLAYHSAAARFMAGPITGARRLVHFAEGTPGIEWVSGEYYPSPRRPGRTAAQAYDDDLVREFWDASARLLGLDAA
ncbi:MAG: SDR family NAD(P)-dependent oxidoreductase [Actinomycetia bacterium]|nr:SDR family NAD(P)-dependent oxidoreductase [Actinomycetes bacterium]